MGEVLTRDAEADRSSDASASEVRLPAAELWDTLRAALGPALASPGAAAAGLTGADADRAALWLTQAEQLGLAGFGTGMLLRDLARLTAAAEPHTAGTLAPAMAPVTAPAPVAQLDAAGLPGPLALAAATRQAREAAATHGVGIVGVRGVGALGVLGFAARSLAVDDLVALVTAQAPAKVAPWGGTRPAIGTNPIAVAAPRGNAAPLVADFATAPITQAELAALGATGTPLPAGTALDAAGHPTLDAARAVTLLPESLLGSLGGLLVELLAGVAVGGRVAAGTPALGRGALILALDPSRAGGSAAAVDTTQLAADWRAAGGHVPGRFDALPLTGGRSASPVFAANAEVTVAAEELRALRTLVEGIAA